MNAGLKCVINSKARRPRSVVEAPPTLEPPPAIVDLILAGAQLPPPHGPLALINLLEAGDVARAGAVVAAHNDPGEAPSRFTLCPWMSPLPPRPRTTNHFHRNPPLPLTITPISPLMSLPSRKTDKARSFRAHSTWLHSCTGKLLVLLIN